MCLFVELPQQLLQVYVDVLCLSPAVVDMCCRLLAVLLPQPSVWQSIRQRLVQPGGRVMCNLGTPPGLAGASPAHIGRTLAALDAMAEAFEGGCIH